MKRIKMYNTHRPLNRKLYTLTNVGYFSCVTIVGGLKLDLVVDVSHVFTEGNIKFQPMYFINHGVTSFAYKIKYYIPCSRANHV